MIIFFGPPGAGKSVQGQLLAAEFSWRWIGIGQLLRDVGNSELIEKIQSGDLVDSASVEAILENDINKSRDIKHLILDGFPRRLEQAEWLIEAQARLERTAKLAIVLDVEKDELLKRLKLRGRSDDLPELINERIDLYNREINTILDYLKSQNVMVVRVDGNSTIDQVHNRIVDEVKKCKLA